MKTPILYLAFSNNQDDYLKMINRERKNITRSLSRHDYEGLIKVKTESNSSLEDIFETFINFGESISIFHYGGHAGGTHLQLQDNSLGNQTVFAGGLAELLGRQKNLQLVFLNGCATMGQVELLLNHGVKAVIATSIPIQDQMATEFAEQFYNSLASHTPLNRAFEVATAFIKAKYDEFAPIKIYRTLKFVNEESNQDKELPWGLYCRDENEEVLHWTLPRNVQRKTSLRNRFDYESRPDVNDILIDTICEKIAKYNTSLDFELSKEDFDIPSIKREIVDSFPTPIGEQLRKLFTRSNNPDEPDKMEVFSSERLMQLCIAHRTTVKFICYILLSQLWDEKHKNSDLSISEDYIVNFNSFFALSKNNHESFDYVKFINTITELLDEYEIDYFMEELKMVQAHSHKNKDLYEAYVFMNSLYQSLLDSSVEEAQIPKLCPEAEHHLGVVLNAVAFLVKYRLVTIKNIEIVKEKHTQARFKHSQIILNKALTVANTGIAEEGKEFFNYTDNKSVLFIKTEGNKVVDFLNLTPFIIDENALKHNQSSKLFFFTYRTADQYAYQFLNNLSDELFINNVIHASVKTQFDRFRSEMFGHSYEQARTVNPSRFNRSRFSRNR